MGIKLKDYIQNPYEVFSEEEAEMLYKAAGFIDMQSIYTGYVEIPLKANEVQKTPSIEMSGTQGKYSFSSTVEYGKETSCYEYNDFGSRLQLKVSNIDFKGVA